MTATLGELAALVGCELRGDPKAVVARVGTLASATGDAVTFLANPLYRDQLATTRAAAVVLEPRYADDCPAASLITDNPYAAYARLAAALHPPRQPAPGISADASVADDARVPDSAEVGPQAAIGARAVLGDHVIVGAGAVIGADVTIGEGTRIAPRAAVLDGVQIGRRCVIHSGAVIGADGFGFAFDAGTWTKVPQLGGVSIGDDVEIGANTTVDRGTIDDTIIEDGVKIDNLVQIAHNVKIGAHTVMAAMSGAAGSTRIGRRCRIGGGVVMVNQIEICDDAMFTFRSVVTKSVTEPGVYGGSLAAEDAAKWRRNAARFRRLDALAERVAGLERQLRRLEEKNDD